jgi:TPR repeat protein
MRIFIVLFLIISSIAGAAELTGKIEVKVEESKPEKFSFLFWDWTYKTIGAGSSPNISEQDVKDAIREEFKNPQAAIEQLEKLKGPGGKIQIDYSYVSPCDENLGRAEYDRCQNLKEEREEIEGRLLFSCGVEEENGDPWINSNEYRVGHWETDPEKELNYQIADFGWFYQFKWASKAQIKRNIASCLASLKDMPDLKPKIPSDAPQLKMDPHIYSDFYDWFSKIQGLQLQDKNDPTFKNSVDCLLKNATERFKNRTGNVLVLQKSKTKAFFLYESTLNFSEGHNLPIYLQREGRSNDVEQDIYSIAVMDETSWNNLEENQNEKKIKTQGVWPNIQARSLVSLIGQVYGQDLYMNMNACFLSSGVNIFNPNKIVETFYAPSNCNEEISNNPSFDILELRCENQDAKACLMIGQAHANNNRWKCLPDDQSIDCSVHGLKTDRSKAEEYLTKACGLGLADGCFSAASLTSLPSGYFSSKQREYYQQGCDLNRLPGCEFWTLGVRPITENEIATKQHRCLTNSLGIDACVELSIYYQLNQNEEASMEYSKIACERGSTGAVNPNPCVLVADYYVQQNDKENAIKILEKNCWFKTDKGCSKLYELYDESKKDSLIKKVCWETKKKCF